jgi:hypothetical protein
MRTNGQSQVRLARVLCYRGRISEGEKAVDRIALVSSAVRPSLYPRPYIHGSGAGADGTAIGNDMGGCGCRVCIK